MFRNGNSKGALVLINPQAQVGLSVLHLNRPNLGLSGSDPAPRTLRAGGLYRLERFNVLADLNFRDSRSGDGGEAKLSGGAAAEADLAGYRLYYATNSLLAATTAPPTTRRRST